MTTAPARPETEVGQLTEFKGADLHDLCDAAESAILDGGGFGWLAPPSRGVMESYWQGVLLVPDRRLFVARLDGTIAGSAQLVRPPRNNEAQGPCGTLTTFFIAPWARGFGFAPRLVQAVEDAARASELQVLNLDVRATQERAIQVYEQLGFARWGEHPHYAFVDGKWLTGYYFWKNLTGDSLSQSVAFAGNGADGR